MPAIAIEDALEFPSLILTSWVTMNLICIPFLILILISTFRAEKLSEK